MLYQYSADENPSALTVEQNIGKCPHDKDLSQWLCEQIPTFEDERKNSNYKISWSAAHFDKLWSDKNPKGLDIYNLVEARNKLAEYIGIPKERLTLHHDAEAHLIASKFCYERLYPSDKPIVNFSVGTGFG